MVRAENFEQWDSLTAKFAGAANLPFLNCLRIQIVLNSRNLMAGNKSALLAVPWLGMLTGLLGNLSLLSYFIKKRETEAVVVQMLGVISMYVVILQLAMAEAMPLPHFIVTSIVIVSGLILNFMKYFRLLDAEIWHFWEEFITIGGLSALPQVKSLLLKGNTYIYLDLDSDEWVLMVFAMISAVHVVNVRPLRTKYYLAWLNCLFHCSGCCSYGECDARMGKLSEKGVKTLGYLSGWTATLLFMWMLVAQMWTNLLNPENIKGLSAVSMLLAMIGNVLMIPRALFVRDLMCFNSMSQELFLASTFGFLAWIGVSAC
ncbi:hypothetical protein DH2020_007280 [Rehmannia glutinosa]|uniref:Uncharacterized protein n=1 Tax=Rehmannia glutinosa TaxID=99300 RepID=A0ABR0TXL9_REHGL